jgi:phosphoribosylformylglycinamidine cyclo-ligase
MPPVFRVLQERGELSDAEMLRTFNCGIGMVLLVDAEETEAACELLEALGEEPVVFGEVVRREGAEGPQVVFP